MTVNRRYTGAPRQHAERTPSLTPSSAIPLEVALLRALLSVSDREGIVELARGLKEAGIECYATDGTRRHLGENGIEVNPVTDLTDSPEILGGRVKTLHPNIFAALLARRDQPDHLAQLAEHGVEQIDIVVVNLYPFAETVRQTGDDAGPGAGADRHRRRGAPAGGGQELPGRGRGERQDPVRIGPAGPEGRRAPSARRRARSWRPRPSP